jgi:two-component system sensor kinase FixL
MVDDNKPKNRKYLGGIWAMAIFVAVYLLLDRASHFNNIARTEIAPWAPHVALLIFVAMYRGVRAAPITMITPGIAECVWRPIPPMSVQFLGATVCIGCTYTIVGLILRRMQRRLREPSIAWFATFCAVIGIAALLDAALYPEFLIKTAKLPAGSLLTAVRTDWVGDVNGIIVLVPLSVLLYMGEPGKIGEVRAHLGLLVMQATALTCAFLLTFPEIWGFPQDDTRNPFYLLYLPIIWIALRWGACVTAVALAALQLAIVAFVAVSISEESFLAIQVLMVLLACTGLFMGISVSERARISQLMRSKETELSSLHARMAVSEMNAAIGHELNNPLAALVNYLTSASLILDVPVLDRASLKSALVKAHGEAIRSINVLRKLREFFRSGVVRPELVDPKMLASEGLAAMQAKFRHAHITAVIEPAVEIPAIAADPLQMAMVLQNLLTNAYDALQASSPEHRRIKIGVAHVGDEVMLSVADTGPGIPEAIQDRLFRPVTSTKPVGMGLGLAICRSLVEANDGRISVLRSDSDGTMVAVFIPVAKPGAEEAGA